MSDKTDKDWGGVRMRNSELKKIDDLVVRLPQLENTSFFVSKILNYILSKKDGEIMKMYVEARQYEINHMRIEAK